MPNTKLRPRKSLHEEVFRHYLRTGERFTNAEWLARHERKFNPYHDEIGRFTSPPGVTVSYGDRGGHNESRRPAPDRRPAKPQGVHGWPRYGHDRQGAGAADRTALPGDGSARRAVDTAIARNWSPEAPVETRFDLNRRQFHLDALRQKAGPNPNQIEKAAFEETQRRLDAARARLDKNDRIADREVLEIFRAGLAPADAIAGGINIATGEAELRDYLAVAGAVPLGGAVGKVGKVAAQAIKPAAREIVQLGGAYRAVKMLRGYHGHHIPPKSVSPISKSRGPSIAMLPEHHLATLSYGRGPASVAYRKAQADLIARGEFRKAQQMDIDDIRSKFGNRYDAAIEQMLEYSRKVGL